MDRCTSLINIYSPARHAIMICFNFATSHLEFAGFVDILLATLAVAFPNNHALASNTMTFGKDE